MQSLNFENARRRRERATRKVTFRSCAAGDVIATAWRTEVTWSQRLPKNNQGCLSANLIGNRIVV